MILMYQTVIKNSVAKNCTAIIEVAAHAYEVSLVSAALQSCAEAHLMLLTVMRIMTMVSQRVTDIDFSEIFTVCSLPRSQLFCLP